MKPSSSKKYQNSLKNKVPMPPKMPPLRTTNNATFWFFSKAWASKTIRETFVLRYVTDLR